MYASNDCKRMIEKVKKLMTEYNRVTISNDHLKHF
jgi:hypothetical protein